MPWKVAGEAWHRGPKGFPPGKRIEWDRGLLPRLLEVLRGIEPGIEIAWDNRVAVTFRVPGINRAWAQIRTKECAGLDCRFLGKKGQFNLSQVEKFGTSPRLSPKREGELLHLVFQHDHHLHAPALREILAEHVQGFREVWA